MANNPAAANRVATIIGTFKWIIVGLVGLTGFVVVLVSLFSGDAEGLIVAFVALIGTLLYAVVIFVLFGWFEQTLRMLAEIATNTRSGGFGQGGAPGSAGSYGQPGGFGVQDPYGQPPYGQ